MKDYYEILNISRDASEEEIEEAYQKLVKEYRPGEHSNDSSLIKYFEQIEEAYLTLSNEDKKYIYDQELMDQSAELVWTLRQLDEKEKRKGFRVKTTNKVWTVLGSVVVIGVVLFLFTILDEPDQVTFQSRRSNTDQIMGQERNVASREVTDATSENNIPPGNEEGNSDNRPAEETRSEAAAPPSGENGTNSADESRADDNKGTEMVNLNSLEDYLKAIGNENHSYEEKAAMIDEALKLFEDRESNVLVIGSNEVQTRRETIQNYLDIVMIQSYKVTVVGTEKNSNGKITQISVKEKL